MLDTTREAQLIALTAKALRPIAADLGITGTSRMVKADIIASILRAENADAAKNRLDVADFDEEAVYAQAEALEIHAERETDIKRDREVAEDLGLINPNVPQRGNEYLGLSITNAVVSTAPKTLPTFARRTRRGVETVVVEREHCGRVDYRIIDARTGRRSSIYRLRAVKFAQEFVKVPS